jgi:hypothetical protein
LGVEKPRGPNKGPRKVLIDYLAQRVEVLDVQLAEAEARTAEEKVR